MGMFDWIEFEDGRARFSGNIRALDEGRSLFSVQLPESPEYYGEFFVADDAQAGGIVAEVYSFGYGGKYNVGNPHPNARVAFSDPEAAVIERLIRNLFKKGGELPFPLSPSFGGSVTFRDGWIRQ